jgi:hypothetical protein
MAALKKPKTVEDLHHETVLDEVEAVIPATPNGASSASEVAEQIAKWLEGKALVELRDEFPMRRDASLMRELARDIRERRFV